MEVHLEATSHAELRISQKFCSSTFRWVRLNVLHHHDHSNSRIRQARSHKKQAQSSSIIRFNVEFVYATVLSLSVGEDSRIRRALLHFQFYAQLFHQLEATDELVYDRDWEQRHHQEQYFWTRFTSVGREVWTHIMRPIQSILKSFATSRASAAYHYSIMSLLNRPSLLWPPAIPSVLRITPSLN